MIAAAQIRRGVLWLALLCGLTLLNACGQMLAPAGSTLTDTPQTMAEDYRLKALAHEKQGELQEALLAWRVVQLLDPGNTLAPRIIETLERGIAKAAKVHFERGQGHYRAGRHDEAAREFLITLRLQPGHQRAAYYLRHRVNNRLTVYTVRPGDSFSRIALNVYGDSGLANLVAYYNDMDPRKPLLIGKTLRLPALEKTASPPRDEQRELLEQAAQALTQRRYESVVAVVARMEPGTSYHSQAVRLADDAHFRRGLELHEQSRYLEALEQFKQTSEGFNGRNEAIAKARKRLQREDTTAKLKAAETLLHQQAYDRAINGLEEILSCEPDHTEARTLLQSARYALGRNLLDEQRDGEALRVFGSIDQNYQDTAQWMALARGRLTARAETLYRSGVKYFLAEELELAVEAWEQALALNPEHPKARQDIENALRLLDRWRGLKKE